MKAPIVTTTNIVPKNIVGEPVYGAISKGASTPEKIRPVDSPKLARLGVGSAHLRRAPELLR
jgi:hypothetical protein